MSESNNCVEGFELNGASIDLDEQDDSSPFTSAAPSAAPASRPRGPPVPAEGDRVPSKRMRGGGRPKGDAASHFKSKDEQVTGVDGKINTFRVWLCAFCSGASPGGKSQANVLQETRARAHLIEKCTDCPSDVKAGLMAKSGFIQAPPATPILSHAAGGSSGQGPPTTSTTADATAPAPGSATARGKNAKLAGMITGWFDCVSAADAMTITRAIMIFILGCGLSFNIVSSPFFVALICALRPGYLRWLPSETTFRRKWLKVIYQTTATHLQRIFSGSSCYRTIMWDGFVTDGGKHVSSGRLARAVSRARRMRACSLAFLAPFFT